jgi:hypothetical protein
MELVGWDLGGGIHAQYTRSYVIGQWHDVYPY